MNKEGDKLAILHNSFYEDLSSNGIVQLSIQRIRRFVELPGR